MYKILVVDDNKEYLQVLREMLTMEGFNILTAVNDSEALEILERNPDTKLVLSDKDFPLRGETKDTINAGIDLLATSRKRNPRIIRCLMSGRIDEVRERFTADSSVVQYLFAKPIPDFAHFVGTLRTILEGTVPVLSRF